MDPFLFIPAAASVVGNALNYFSNQETNKANIAMSREQMDWQHDEAQLARQWQEQMYNKYQSPERQVEQIRRAGLNPALVYGQGSVGSFQSSAASSPSAPSLQPYRFNDTGIQQAMSLYAQSESGANKLANAQAENVNIKNRYENERQQRELAEIISRTKKGTAEYELAKQQYDHLQAVNAIRKMQEDQTLKLTQANIQKVHEDIAYSRLQRELAQHADERAQQQLWADLKRINAEINLMASQGRLNDSTRLKVDKETLKVIEDTLHVKLDNDTKRQLSHLVIEETKGNHELWKLGHETDMELFPLDSFVERVANILGAGLAGAGIKKMITPKQ